MTTPARPADHLEARPHEEPGLPAVPETSWTTVAHLLRSQGRKGEVLAELLTDFPRRFSEFPEVYLAPVDFAGPSTAARRMEISAHWLPVGRNAGRVVFSFSGICSIEQAESLAGLDVLVPADQRVPLEEGEEYIDDLVGCVVFDVGGDGAGEPVGTVSGVDFPTTPDGSRRLEDAAPLLTVQSRSGDEVLIPFVQSFLVSLSVEDKRIEMRLPAGLVDLNRAVAADEDTGAEQAG